MKETLDENRVVIECCFSYDTLLLRCKKFFE